nr:nuclear transport factor 2 family protein [Massilia violaceinigra]
MTMNAVPGGPSEPDKQHAPGAAGGGPPHDGGTERRLTALETRFDTILPMLATKADLAELRLDMDKSGKEGHGTLTKAMMWFGALAIGSAVLKTAIRPPSRRWPGCLPRMRICAIPIVEHGAREQVAAFWRSYRASFGTVRSSFSHITADRHCAGLFWRSTGTGAHGRPVGYDGVTLLEFDETGKITRFHPGRVCAGRDFRRPAARDPRARRPVRGRPLRLAQPVPADVRVRPGQRLRAAGRCVADDENRGRVRTQGAQQGAGAGFPY